MQLARCLQLVLSGTSSFLTTSPDPLFAERKNARAARAVHQNAESPQMEVCWLITVVLFVKAIELWIELNVTG